MTHTEDKLLKNQDMQEMPENCGKIEIFGEFCVVNSSPFPLTYSVGSLEMVVGQLVVGQPVVLTVRGKKAIGVFLKHVQKPNFACVKVEALLPYSQPFPQSVLDLIFFVSRYYLCPLGRVTSLLAPGFFWNVKKRDVLEKRLKKWFQFDFGEISSHETGIKSTKILPIMGKTEKKFSDPNSHSAELPVNPLSQSQAESLEIIIKGEKSVTLLEGVTGSGKTEVYLHAVMQMLALGRNCLILVPEIALTPQMTDRFRAHFGDHLALLHSGLESTEYEKEWFRILLGQTKIVLGVRTAVFCPLKNIGLIIIDEEHDSSYKTDEMPTTQARDVAVMRAQIEGARCVLGSATPSLESYYNVTQKKYNYAKLTQSFSGNKNAITVVDIRGLVKQSQSASSKSAPTRSSSVQFNGKILSREVIDKIEDVTRKGEQTILIFNKRGFSSFALCASCSSPMLCPRCSVSTTLHRNNQVEICHYCGFERRMRNACDTCSSPKFLIFGAGTQSIESELNQVLPALRTARLDRDILTSQKRLREVIDGFRKKEFDVLIGTQILAKGHDFPNVTLVAIIHVEDGLFLPDFRASERTFQLITQSAGRTGRGKLIGQVVVQSLVPDHPVLFESLKKDLNGFRNRELALRSLAKQPPFFRQILLEFKGKSESATSLAGHLFKEQLLKQWETKSLTPAQITILGPFPAPIEKIHDQYRFQICISFAKNISPEFLMQPLIHKFKPKEGVQLRVDVDPYSFQ